MSSQFLEILPLKLSILRLGPSDEIPTPIYKSKFYTISKSEKELSIVAETSILAKYSENPIVWRPMPISLIPCHVFRSKPCHFPWS